MNPIENPNTTSRDDANPSEEMIPKYSVGSYPIAWMKRPSTTWRSCSTPNRTISAAHLLVPTPTQQQSNLSVSRVNYIVQSHGFNWNSPYHPKRNNDMSGPRNLSFPYQNWGELSFFQAYAVGLSFNLISKVSNSPQRGGFLVRNTSLNQ